MCDYSLEHVKSRPASIGDKLVTKRFGTTAGLGDIKDTEAGLLATAVCLLPGTEIAFDEPVKIMRYNPLTQMNEAPILENKTARFRQVDKELPFTHHDALEFGDGQLFKLNELISSQTCTVLQMPAQPKTEVKAQEQQLEAVG
jgi:hypothetical protein